MIADLYLAQKLYDAGDAIAARDKCLALISQKESVGEAHHLLGIFAKQEGNSLEAVSHFCQALDIEASDSLTRRHLLDTLPPIEWDDVHKAGLFHELCHHLRASFQISDFDIRKHLPVVVAAIQSSDPFQRSIGYEGKVDPAQPWLAELMADRLLQAVIKSEIIPLENFETVLTRLRCYLLKTAINTPTLLKSVPIEFCAALAHQAYLTEYAYYLSDEERDWLKKLRNDLTTKIETGEKLHPTEVMKLIISACYAPLGEWLEKFFSGEESAEFESLAQLQILNPLEEIDLDGQIESLTPISDQTSQDVKAQYEQNPFPRWSMLTRPAPNSIAATLQFFFPHFEPPQKLSGPCEILIPGCGTGQQPILEALRYPNSQVTAIDLSRASLAYAARKAKEYDATNIDFLEGDILELENYDETFDVIECTGVLHHMADPLAGWQALISQLTPGGVMKIGLYSELARRHITAAQLWIKEQGLAATPDVIRNTRQKILTLEPDDPKRQVTGFTDFYSISGARDLLFHVQESTFTFPKIQDALHILDLELIGLQITNDSLKNNYQTQFPDDPAMTNLDNWHQFEHENPDSFQEMYIFWCRAL
jgi:SAM-dependent methyltransferase